MFIIAKIRCKPAHELPTGDYILRCSTDETIVEFWSTVDGDWVEATGLDLTSLRAIRAAMLNDT